MLDKNLKCEECLKEHCKQIEWMKSDHKWVCFKCADKRLKEVKKIQK